MPAPGIHDRPPLTQTLDKPKPVNRLLAFLKGPPTVCSRIDKGLEYQKSVGEAIEVELSKLDELLKRLRNVRFPDDGSDPRVDVPPRYKTPARKTRPVDSTSGLLKACGEPPSMQSLHSKSPRPASNASAVSTATQLLPEDGDSVNEPTVPILVSEIEPEEEPLDAIKVKAGVPEIPQGPVITALELQPCPKQVVFGTAIESPVVNDNKDALLATATLMADELMNLKKKIDEGSELPADRNVHSAPLPNETSD